MKLRSCALLLSLAATARPAGADDTNPYKVSVTTLITTPPLAIEGLTNDNSGNMYAPGRATAAGQPCPVYQGQHPPAAAHDRRERSAARRRLVFTERPCLRAGRHALRHADRFDLSLHAQRFEPAHGDGICDGVPGTNGLAFDWNGFLWTGDGTTAAGRVWMIDRNGTPMEMFRIPPMVNEVNQADGGIGRDVRSLPPGTVAVTATSRNASNLLGSQPLVANGLAFDHRGNLIIADTARGALWRVRVSQNSTPITSTGCDTTYTANTLCMDHIFAQHAFLEGVDGIVVDNAGNIWSSVNERNALTYTYGNSGRTVESSATHRTPRACATKARSKHPRVRCSSISGCARPIPTATAATTSPTPRGRSSPPVPIAARSRASNRASPSPGIRLPIQR